MEIILENRGQVVLLDDNSDERRPMVFSLFWTERKWNDRGLMKMRYECTMTSDERWVVDTPFEEAVNSWREREIERERGKERELTRGWSLHSFPALPRVAAALFYETN